MVTPVFHNLPERVRSRLLDASAGAKIALPETADPRIQQAARILEDSAGVDVVLVDEQAARNREAFTRDVIRERALHRNKSASDAQLSKASEPLYTAGALLQRGEVDAVVAGAVSTTAEVIRAVLATVGLQPSCPLLTSCFLFRLAAPTAGGEDVVLYADAGVIPQPSDAQLSQIALLSAQAYQAWVDRDPRVAFLSFSTHGSAQHPDADKMKNAAAEFAQVAPTILSEGELQFDAAVDPAVALRKNPASQLQGRANVFVFPDLDAGNIAYKITQRLAGAEAWGPLLLGSAKPFSDLSRGASALDIAHVALLTASLARLRPC
jgi:phosphotransacetylase